MEADLALELLNLGHYQGDDDMHDRGEQADVLERIALAKAAVTSAISENKQLGLRDSEPPTEQEIAEEIAVLDFSLWKSVPVA